MAFWGKEIGYFEGWGQVQIVLGSTHIVQQLLFSLFPSILAFDFDLILGLFLTFWALMGCFRGLSRVQKLLPDHDKIHQYKEKKLNEIQQ